MKPEPTGTEWPESWRVLEGGLRKGRYVDKDFAQLEREKLWKRVWQFAARVDEIPEVGDYAIYEICDQSAFIVRVEKDLIKAYHNFCPHRGTALCTDSGSFDKGRIICPFHGWKWDLHGQNHFVLERHEFHGGKLKDQDVALKELHVAVFEGFVFVNFDRNPVPFDEFIAPVRERIESLALGKMHHYWWKRADVPANWKVAQEAFHETYHVAATHPQLDEPGRKLIYEDVEPQGDLMHSTCGYEAYPMGHGRFWDDPSGRVVDPAVMRSEAVLEGMIGLFRMFAEGMDAMYFEEDVETIASLRGKPLPEDSSYGEEFIKAIYEKAAAQGRPMPAPVPEVIGQWGGEIFVFPNLLILPGAGRVMMYRSRPKGDDPDQCIFEIFSTTSYPGDTGWPRAEVIQVTDVTDPEQLLLIPRQDMANIPRIQHGLKSFGCKQVWLASHHEKIIMNMHRELDRYLRDEALTGREESSE
ncbi:MAG TPA: SRPBCC family protein [Porticoccaceae bacterium]